MFDISVFGVLKVIRPFVQPMLDKQRSIVNVSSGGSVGRAVEEGVWTGRNPAFRNQPDDASKAALTNMSSFSRGRTEAAQRCGERGLSGRHAYHGSDEMVAGREALGIRVGALLRPEHVVPLVLHLASHGARGDTGRAFDAVHWNLRPRHGSPDAWLAHAQ